MFLLICTLVAIGIVALGSFLEQIGIAHPAWFTLYGVACGMLVRKLVEVFR